jgi:tRNA uridine 5-carboxymethylaminomethyl modification enzyme
LLRQDNADIRLTEIGYKIGLASNERVEKVRRKYIERDKVIKWIKQESVKPEEINSILSKAGTREIKQSRKLDKILLRPEISIIDLEKGLEKVKKRFDEISEMKEEIIESVEIEIKYKGYIEREEKIAKKIQRLENIKLKEEINYLEMLSISTEGRQKLSKIKPETIGQASRISGVSPSDINVLLVYMGR